MNRYNPSQIETKWQASWKTSGLYQAKDFAEQPKFMMLTEFPYPSGDGLHLGHAREYTLGDILARFKRMQGYNVMFPMGYDAFGLPTENYAIKNKIAPQLATEKNIANFQKQFNATANGVQGSGWAALSWEPTAGKLVITQVFDHQSNLQQLATPLLVLDMWEHAFYLQYKNVKGDWVTNWWNIINWSDVATKLSNAR